MYRVSLKPVPPFRLDLTVWVLRRRPDNVIDRWEHGAYRRVLVVNGTAVEVEVVQHGRAVEVTATGPRLGSAVRARVEGLVERLLGVAEDLQPFYTAASRDARLAGLVERFRGVKPPRFPSVFETLVNAITCQQLSLDVGLRLLNRLTQRYGPVAASSIRMHPRAFPGPDILAPLEPEALRSLGYSRSKSRAVIGLARAIVSGEVDPEAWAALPTHEALARLLALPGVGRWTAEYTLLRGLGRHEVFPVGDVGARRNLERVLGCTEPLSDQAVQAVLSRWEPYGGLLYFHLLLDGLDRAGHLT